MHSLHRKGRAQLQEPGYRQATEAQMPPRSTFRSATCGIPGTVDRSGQGFLPRPQPARERLTADRPPFL